MLHVFLGHDLELGESRLLFLVQKIMVFDDLIEGLEEFGHEFDQEVLFEGRSAQFTSQLLIMDFTLSEVLVQFARDFFRHILPDDVDVLFETRRFRSLVRVHIDPELLHLLSSQSPELETHLDQFSEKILDLCLLAALSLKEIDYFVGEQTSDLLLEPKTSNEERTAEDLEEKEGLFVFQRLVLENFLKRGELLENERLFVLANEVEDSSEVLGELVGLCGDLQEKGL